MGGLDGTGREGGIGARSLGGVRVENQLRWFSLRMKRSTPVTMKDMLRVEGTAGRREMAEGPKLMLVEQECIRGLVVWVLVDFVKNWLGQPFAFL